VRWDSSSGPEELSLQSSGPTLKTISALGLQTGLAVLAGQLTCSSGPVCHSLAHACCMKLEGLLGPNKVQP